MAYTYESEDSLVRDGDYEATIEKIEVKTLPSGTEKLTIQYRIRKDVNQPYGNKVLFEDIFHEKNSPEHFNRKRINRLLGTQDIKEGTIFESINDIIVFMRGKQLQIHVSIVFSEYYSKDVNTISYYKKTEHPFATPTPGGSVPNGETPAEDDLPF